MPTALCSAFKNLTQMVFALQAQLNAQDATIDSLQNVAMTRDSVRAIARGEGAFWGSLGFADLEGVNLAGVDLDGYLIDSGNGLEGANFAGANLTGARLGGVSFKDADFSNADLTGAGLYGADLSGADFSGADLSGAMMTCLIGCPEFLPSDYTCEPDPNPDCSEPYPFRIVQEQSGCTNPAYTEYSASADTDDGSCATLVVGGCTDSTDVNYDPAANTADGSCVSCSSIAFDGYTYSAIEIGDQCWFAENLRTTVYADGSAIQEVTDDTAWIGLSTGALCSYYNAANSLATFGRLYNWHAVDDTRGLCPSGWHVPTDGEWTNVENYITSQGFNGTVGMALKSSLVWFSGSNGTDDYGFSALPGGYRDANGDLQQCLGQRLLVEFFAQWRQCMVPSLE